MAIKRALKPGGGAAQNQDEKKDHPHRGDGRGGHDRVNDFDDPQAEQAKGRRRAVNTDPGSPAGGSKTKKASS